MLKPTNTEEARVQQGRRIAAARIYAGLKQPELAQRMGISVSSLSRLERGDKAAAVMNDDSMRELGKLISDGIPEWFMTSGFNVPVDLDTPTLTEEVEALRRQMDTVLDILTRRAAAPGSQVAPPEDREDPGASPGRGLRP